MNFKYFRRSTTATSLITYISMLICAAIASMCAFTNREASNRQGIAIATTQAREVAHKFSSTHDFGVIIDEGQTLSHSFRLSNPTANPIRILKAEALSPCCSSIGVLPERIPAHGEVTVPVRLKLGYQSGVKTAGFSIRTDDIQHPLHRLTLRAHLVAAFEVHPVSDGASEPVFIRRPATRMYRVVCRRMNGAGRDAPIALKSEQGVGAEFDREASITFGTNGIEQSERRLTIRLPSSTEAGWRKTAISVVWPDSSSKDFAISWEVVPVVRVTPSALVLRRDEISTPKTVLVQCDDRPVDIHDVRSSILSSFRTEPSHKSSFHRLSLRFDPSAIRNEKTFDILIRTSHPDQPEAQLSVLLLTEREE
jgi:hypothetical protein